jgi:hypothetical protein
MGFCSAVPRPLSLFFAGGWRNLIAPPSSQNSNQDDSREETKTRKTRIQEKVKQRNPRAGPKNHGVQGQKKNKDKKRRQEFSKNSELEVRKRTATQLSDDEKIPEEPTGVPHSGQAFISGR